MDRGRELAEGHLALRPAFFFIHSRKRSLSPFIWNISQ